MALGNSPFNNLVKGGALAAAQHSGFTQTDVFTVDQNGIIRSCWVSGSGEWEGPYSIGSSLPDSTPGAFLAASPQIGAPNQTDLFVIDKAGQLNVRFATSANEWQGPIKIGPTGITTPGGF
jgi:hypothetical protein